MKKVNITLEEWSHTCADGCCSDYGTKIYLNGKELEHPNPAVDYNGYVGISVDTALLSVLKELGYEVEIDVTFAE